MVSRSLPFHHLGGMESIAWDVARELAQLGCDVTVLTTACQQLEPECEREGVSIVTVPSPPGRYSLAWWRGSRRLYRERFADKVDTILSVSAGALSIAATGVDRRRLVAQIHGTALGEFRSKIVQRSLRGYVTSIKNLGWLPRDLLYRKFGAFVAVGDSVVDDLRNSTTRWVMGTHIPIELIPNGVSPDTFAFNTAGRLRIRSQFQIPEGARVVISASRLHPQKGIYEGIEGFRVAAEADKNLYYLIAGSGPDQSRLEARVNELGLSEKVKFVGIIPRNDLRDFLSAADLFLFTTKRVEGLPMNILEALAAGLPVIASRHVMHSDFPGIAVDPNAPHDIAKAISAIEQKESRQSLLPEQYALAHCAKAYRSLFEKLLSGVVS